MGKTEEKRSGTIGLNGPWPGKPGVIPVTDGKAGDANGITRNYLDSIQIEERLIGAEKPDLTTEIFGRTYSAPIMTPAFSHLTKVGMTDRNPMEEYAEAAKRLNILNFVGMESDETYEGIASKGADTVRIIKPFSNHDRILEEIAFAAEHGAVAVGIDIDHVFGTDGGYDVVDGQTMGPVKEEDLERYVKAAGDLPFVAKGVLSAEDAAACRRAGVRAIFLSHHHGRMPFAIPPLLALQEILRELPDLKQDVTVFVDCHIDDGIDAYKALALGADAVSVGRGILPGLLQDGTEGVIRKVESMEQELSMMMGYTGVRDTNHFTRSVLRYGGERM